MLNLERAVLMMARVEIANQSGTWDQNKWGLIHLNDGQYPDQTERGEIIVDMDTGLPLGIGSCNTARCAAGWALFDEGSKMRWISEGAGTLTAYTTLDGRYISRVACEWLGIEHPEGFEHDDTYDERWNYEEDHPKLFDVDNEMVDLYAYLAQWWTENVPPHLTTDNAKEEYLKGLVYSKVEQLQRAVVSP
jgi:hypothetical protein